MAAGAPEDGDGDGSSSDEDGGNPDRGRSPIPQVPRRVDRGSSRQPEKGRRERLRESSSVWQVDVLRSEFYFVCTTIFSGVTHRTERDEVNYENVGGGIKRRSR